MSAEVATPEIMVFTDSAANKVRELIEEEGQHVCLLRDLLGQGCAHAVS